MAEEFKFGITGVENIGEGESILFSSDDATEITDDSSNEAQQTENIPVDKVQPTIEEPKESLLFSEDESTEEEEKEEVEKKPKIEDPKEIKEEEEDNENPYKSLAEDLYNLGIFTESEEDEDITSPESLKEKFQKEKINGANQFINNFLSKFGPDHVEAFNAIFVNGVNPREYLKESVGISDFEELDLEDEFNQEKAVSEYYKLLGWEDSRIHKKLQKLKDYDDLKEESEVAKEHLVKHKKENLQQIETRRKAELAAKKHQEDLYNSTIQNTLVDKLKKKDFDGIPLNEKEAQKVFETFTVKKWVLPNGEQLSDFEKLLLDLKKPENHDKAIKFALLYNNNFDLSKIKTKAISEEASTLFKSVKTREKAEKRGSTKSNNFII